MGIIEAFYGVKGWCFEVLGLGLMENYAKKNTENEVEATITLFWV